MTTGYNPSSTFTYRGFRFILFNRKDIAMLMISDICRAIEGDLERNFPGFKGTFRINDDLSWDIIPDDGSKRDFYDLYPNLTRKDADAQFYRDIQDIIRKHFPEAGEVEYRVNGNATEYIQLEES